VYVHTADFYNEHGIELWTSTPVQAIDTAARELALQSGERIHFDRLLLTTGAEPRRLRVPGSHLDEVLYLVTVPIGAWVASLVFDLASHVIADPGFLARGSL
jgi:3-phenylpropionate/trans-cinnamate dioxygenase ferredoxin reductase subunit